jgi:hypothetical protein
MTEKVLSVCQEATIGRMSDIGIGRHTKQLGETLNRSIPASIPQRNESCDVRLRETPKTIGFNLNRKSITTPLDRGPISRAYSTGTIGKETRSWLVTIHMA